MQKPSRNRRPRQLGLALPNTWGGARKNAGRKPVVPGRVPHVTREALASRFPVHVTLKLDQALPSLRSPGLCRIAEGSLRVVKRRGRLRVVHYSLQKRHVHLVVEASDAKALSNGVMGLSISLAKRLNKSLGRSGRVFEDRYFARILRTPRQTRNCLCYVINNCRRHDAQRRRTRPEGWIDPCSSGDSFDGWRDVEVVAVAGRDPPVSEAHGWLLKVGWRRHGLISVDEVPGEV